MNSLTDQKILECTLALQPKALLLFSGGLDSTLLLAVAAQVLGPGLTALTVTGPHTARSAECQAAGPKSGEAQPRPAGTA